MAIGASLITALTEPVLPALMKPLLDKGFGQADIPLWLVPVVIIGLFVLRGAAGFVAQYALAWAANQGVLNLRRAMFERLLGAHPALFTRHTASNLTNTLVYEVQQGANLLVSALLTLVRDSLTLVALLGYLIWLNWKLTLFVGVMFPLVVRGGAARSASGMRRITLAGQKATDELAYVVEENVLAWRIVRAARRGAASRPSASSTRSNLLRRLMMKAVAAAATDDAGDADADGLRAVGRDRGRAVAEPHRRHHGGRLRRLHHRHADAAGADQEAVRGERARSRAAWRRWSAAWR